MAPRIDIIIVKCILLMSLVDSGQAMAKVWLSSELQSHFCDQIAWICFNGTPYYNRAGRVYYNNLLRHPQTSVCCRSRRHNAHRNIMCCGDRKYKPDVEKCCSDGNVGIEWCGAIAYDPATLQCCSDGNVGSECCGTIAYDPATMQCCSDGHVGQACCGNIGYDPVTLNCCSNGSLALDCCGVVGYDSTYLTCCSPGNVGINCCGSAGYDPGMGLNGTECCGNSVYDPASWLCCDGKLHSITTTATLKCCKNHCCPPDQEVYDDAVFLCCGGLARRENNPTRECCGEMPYDATVFRCTSDGQVELIPPIIGSTAWFRG